MILWNLRSQRMSRQHNKQAHCMLSTEVQRSVRLNKKKKSTNISPYPDEAIERLARAFYPAILACWNSEEGQREFAAWQAEQAHISGKEKGAPCFCFVIIFCPYYLKPPTNST